jgi:chromate reductase
MGEAMAQDQLDVRVICGSLRKGSYNAALARMLPKLAPAGMTITEAPPFDGFPHYNHDLATPADVTAFADGVREADGVIFVSPEYNWTIPGAMKNALDWVTRFKEQPFKDKPVAIQSVSASPIGGTRMQNHLRQSLISIDAVCFGRPEVFVATAKNKFDETTLELKDQPSIDIVTLQLAGFDEFIRRVGKKT